MEHQHVAEMMGEKNWAIMDIEYIRTSKTHRCVRKLYILAKDGLIDLELGFYPCKRYSEIERKYQQSFRFCRAHIHKLQYDPKHYSPACSTLLAKVNIFIVNNNIELILYKGGTVEKDLCSELCIPSANIEYFGELEKVCSHNPKDEVNSYYAQLVNFYK